MFESSKPTERFPVNISPDNWARVEPLITSALRLDNEIDDMELNLAMMKVKATAIHRGLWEEIRRMYPQVNETPCHINTDARRIEAITLAPFMAASWN